MNKEWGGKREGAGRPPMLKEPSAIMLRLGKEEIDLIDRERMTILVENRQNKERPLTRSEFIRKIIRGFFIKGEDNVELQ